MINILRPCTKPDLSAGSIGYILWVRTSTGPSPHITRLGKKPCLIIRYFCYSFIYLFLSDKEKKRELYKFQTFGI